MSRFRRSLTALACALVLPAQAVARAEPDELVTQCSATHFRGDPRLGPEVLPEQGPVGAQLVGYRRTGELGEQQFLDTYWDAAAGWWRYPPAGGYLLDGDGKPLVGQAQLLAGNRVDRYGSEFGQYLAPAGSSYGSRSIPPQSLVSTPAAYCNYRSYLVLKPFTVDSGPIAPWFGQPGRGRQFQLKAEHVPGAPSPLTVAWLLDNGYLHRVIGPPRSQAG